MVKMWYYAGMLFLRARELPTTKGEKMLKRGFISRSASVVTLVGALALLSSISGVTAGTIDDSVGNAQQSPSSLVFSSTSADGFSYSRWLENQGTVPASADSASTDESQADQGQAPITYGSFVLTETPLERIYGNVKDSWTQTFSNIITRAGDTRHILRGWAMDYVTGQDVDIQADIDSWWDQRRADTTGIFVGMADVLTDNIFQVGEEQVGGLSFIRSLDWDYQTELGGRPWQLGINAIGSLREADDDVILWQLRGFTAKDSKGGANAGLIYRRAHEDTAMFGVNVFLDYEAHDLGDFTRWSVGGEVRTEWVDLYGNRYMAITDPILQSGGDNDGLSAYSKDGLDLEVAFHVPDMRWISGHIKYYLWEGQNEADETGFVYGVKVSPPMAENLRLELELDDQDGSDIDVGGRISYRHEFGGIPSGTRTAGASSFDPRDYFFEPVRREYAQRIGLSGPSGEKATISPNAPGARMILSSAADGVTLNVTVDANMPEATFSRANPITIVVDEDGADGVTITAVGMDIAAIDGNGYGLSLSDATKISFEDEGELVYLFNGNLYISRDGVSPESIATPGISVRLIGTDMRIAHMPADVKTEITLYEGEISLSYDSGAEFVASVAGNAQIHDDAVNGDGETYYACNDTSKQSSDGKFIGVTSVADCALKATVTPDPTAGTVIAAVGLPKELIHFSVNLGVGAYTFELTSNPKNYFVVDRSDADSNIFRISVIDVPESEDSFSYVIGWRVTDEFEGVDSGNITVLFTKAPSAASIAPRYAVVNQAYSETINIPVVGGVRDSAVGYTLSIAGGTTGYSLGSSTGTSIVLIASETYTEVGVNYVTVSVYDSQDPPQSGTFVLEVRVVPVLSIVAPASALEIFQTESASLLSLVSGGNDHNEATNERTFQIVEGNDDGDFSIDNNGVLVVGTSAMTVLSTLKVAVAESVPSQNATVDVEVSVKFKASDVSLPGKPHEYTVDPADAPVTLVLPAAVGGYGIYTYSLGSGAPTYVRLSLNTLFVDAGLPSSGQASFDVNVIDNDSTFPSGVSNEDTAQVVLNFNKQLAKVIIGAGGKVEVDGTEYATEGDEIEFDSTSSELVVVKVLEGAAYITYPHSDPDRVWGISLSADSNPANMAFIDAYYLGPTEQGETAFLDVSYDLDLSGATAPLKWAASLADESVLRGQQAFIFTHSELTNVWGPQPKGTYYLCPYISFFTNYQCGPETNAPTTAQYRGTQRVLSSRSPAASDNPLYVPPPVEGTISMSEIVNYGPFDAVPSDYINENGIQFRRQYLVDTGGSFAFLVGTQYFTNSFLRGIVGFIALEGELWNVQDESTNEIVARISANIYLEDGTDGVADGSPVPNKCTVTLPSSADCMVDDGSSFAEGVISPSSGGGNDEYLTAGLEEYPVLDGLDTSESTLNEMGALAYNSNDKEFLVNLAERTADPSR